MHQSTQNGYPKALGVAHRITAKPSDKSSGQYNTLEGWLEAPELVYYIVGGGYRTQVRS